MKPSTSSFFRDFSRKRLSIFRQPAAGITLLLLTSWFGEGVHAQSPGTPDMTFGSGGRTASQGFSFTNCVALQGDRKILVGGSGENDVRVTRFKDDGAVDPAFGGGDGIATVNLGGDLAGIYAVAVQPDGKILAAGDGRFGNSFDPFLIRFNVDGSPDPTFGGGDGVEIVNWSAGQDEFQGAMVVMPNGKIVCAGSVVQGGVRKPAVMRYLANGQPDPSFDGDGLATFSPGALGGDVSSLAHQPDGKLLLCGQMVTAFGQFWTETEIMLIRCLENGAPDPAFGDGDGIVVAKPGSALVSRNQACLQPDGKIIVAGSGREGFVLRFHPDGTLDSSFGGGTGKAVIPPAISLLDFTYNPQCLVLPTGGLLIGLSSELNSISRGFPKLVLTGLFSDGMPDPALEPGGERIILNPSAEGNWFEFQGMAVQLDGKVVVVGNEQLSDGTVLGQTVARYHLFPAATDPLQAWRLLHFGTTANTGDAANDADPNGNGVVNLMEFAMGTPPKTPHAGGLPLPVIAGTSLQFTYSRSKSAAPKVSLILEWSDTLGQGSWSTAGVAEQLTGTAGDLELILATMPAGPAGRRYGRLRTTIR